MAIKLVCKGYFNYFKLLYVKKRRKIVDKKGGFMLKIKWLGMVVACCFIYACGSTGTSSSSGSSGSSDSGSSGSSGGSSGSSDTSTGFTVSGTLSSTSVSLNKSLGSGTITDIMAVSPKTAGAECKKASVASGGIFNIKIDGKKPWFLYFLDRAKQGAAMFMGRLQASSAMTTFTPAETTGSMDVGTVTVDATNETATPSKTESEITSGLGLDSTTTETLKSVDGAAKRYGNPDMDNDGSVDCNSETKTTASYFLDFHMRYDMQTAGVNAKVSDVVDAYLGDTMLPSYNSTGIYVAYPDSYSSTKSGTITFVDSAVTTQEGGAISANTPSSDITVLDDFGSYHGWGVNLGVSTQTYSGDIIFIIGGSKTLTFTDVAMPSLTVLQSPTGRIFPFIKFTKSDPSCTSNCTIASFSYKWMKKTASGWTPATLSEVNFLVASGGIGFRYALETASTKYINYSFSTEKISDSVTWAPANFSLQNVTDSEFQNLYTSQICHVGLNHDDKLGFRYFQNIYNSTGTCE